LIIRIAGKVEGISDIGGNRGGEVTRKDERDLLKKPRVDILDVEDTERNKTQHGRRGEH